MARGFSCGLQYTIDLLRSFSSPGFERPMSPWGLMGSFGLRRGEEEGGGGGGYSNDKSVQVSDFQMIAGMPLVGI